MASETTPDEVWQGHWVHSLNFSYGQRDYSRRGLAGSLGSLIKFLDAKTRKLNHGCSVSEDAGKEEKNFI